MDKLCEKCKEVQYAPSDMNFKTIGSYGAVTETLDMDLMK